ncbi:hypothetical protein BUALT_Bualt04G0047800 [Buddleja alternifolia]|uniref:BolA-like protein n=1 Tax=Buddleja alternifolia TaxID=168488 RepID=A0AAV6XQS0_9LAMI|nr:hypothetical protein BUALT_Bualt04G0047800 [Buddleja alternifolia]
MAVTKEQVESTLNSKLNPSHLAKLSGGIQCIWRQSRAKITENSVSLRHISDLGNVEVLEGKDVIDTSGGCGASFSIEIVSEQFEGKRLLERHRMVNGALVEEMKQIHALSITKALTPDQWKQQQDAQKSQAAA